MSLGFKHIMQSSTRQSLKNLLLTQILIIGQNAQLLSLHETQKSPIFIFALFGKSIIFPFKLIFSIWLLLCYSNFWFW